MLSVTIFPITAVINENNLCAAAGNVWRTSDVLICAKNTKLRTHLNQSMMSTTNQNPLYYRENTMAAHWNRWSAWSLLYRIHFHLSHGSGMNRTSIFSHVLSRYQKLVIEETKKNSQTGKMIKLGLNRLGLPFLKRIMILNDVEFTWGLEEQVLSSSPNIARDGKASDFFYWQAS